MKAYLSIFCLIIFSCKCRVFSSCVTCEYNTPREQCKDPYVLFGPEEEACDDVDEELCMRYGDYAIFCNSGGAIYTCKKQGQCGDIVPISCVTCQYGTPRHHCRDRFTPLGPIGDLCDNDETNGALCKKYGDFAIYCGGSGSSTACFKQGQCRPTDELRHGN